jgi:hypothetical protein
MRSRQAARSPHGNQSPDPHDRFRRGRVAFVPALASIALLVGACGSGSARSSSTAIPASNGTGAVTRPGSGSGSQSGNRSVDSYSLAFGRCMRVHGVPKFPNPNGEGSQLGPDSGVKPTSRVFQAALNGPCESLAPAGWVSSGPVTK